MQAREMFNCGGEDVSYAEYHERYMDDATLALRRAIDEWVNEFDIEIRDAIGILDMMKTSFSMFAIENGVSEGGRTALDEDELDDEDEDDDEYELEIDEDEEE